MEVNNFSRLMEIYNAENFNVNSMLRINFVYNGVSSFLLYQNSDELKNTFSMCWLVDRTYYFQNFYIHKKFNKFYFNPLLEPTVFNGVKIMFKKNKETCNDIEIIGDVVKKESPVIDYFNYVFNNLDKGIYISQPKKEITQYCDNMPKGCIFFSHFRRQKMSVDMKKKLYSYYKDLKLIDFIISRGQTAVFDNDILNAKDIYLEKTKKSD